jgi:hypothetical protein
VKLFLLGIFVVHAPSALAIAWLLWRVDRVERTLIHHSNRLDRDKAPRAADGEVFDSDD